jgi:hypothetical protein
MSDRVSNIIRVMIKELRELRTGYGCEKQEKLVGFPVQAKKLFLL